jgi:hypothetical protein
VNALAALLHCTNIFLNLRRYMASGKELRAQYKHLVVRCVESVNASTASNASSFTHAVGDQLWFAWLLCLQLQSEVAVFGQRLGGGGEAARRRASVEAAMDALCLSYYKVT